MEAPVPAKERSLAGSHIKVPKDVLRIIVSHCPPRVRASLAQTCYTFWKIVDIKYRTIDIIEAGEDKKYLSPETAKLIANPPKNVLYRLSCRLWSPAIFFLENLLEVLPSDSVAQVLFTISTQVIEQFKLKPLRTKSQKQIADILDKLLPRLREYDIKERFRFDHHEESNCVCMTELRPAPKKASAKIRRKEIDLNRVTEIHHYRELEANKTFDFKPYKTLYVVKFCSAHDITIQNLRCKELSISDVLSGKLTFKNCEIEKITIGTAEGSRIIGTLESLESLNIDKLYGHLVIGASTYPKLKELSIEETARFRVQLKNAENLERLSLSPAAKGSSCNAPNLKTLALSGPGSYKFSDATNNIKEVNLVLNTYTDFLWLLNSETVYPHLNLPRTLKTLTINGGVWQAQEKRRTHTPKISDLKPYVQKVTQLSIYSADTQTVLEIFDTFPSLKELIIEYWAYQDDSNRRTPNPKEAHRLNKLTIREIEKYFVPPPVYVQNLSIESKDSPINLTRLHPEHLQSIKLHSLPIQGATTPIPTMPKYVLNELSIEALGNGTHIITSKSLLQGIETISIGSMTNRAHFLVYTPVDTFCIQHFINNSNPFGLLVGSNGMIRHLLIANFERDRDFSIMAEWSALPKQLTILNLIKSKISFPVSILKEIESVYIPNGCDESSITVVKEGRSTEFSTGKAFMEYFKELKSNQ